MKRIRTLALAAVAALAMTASFGATGASASEFVADEYPAERPAGGLPGIWFYFGSAPYACSTLETGAIAMPESGTLTMGGLTPKFCSSGQMTITTKFNGCQIRLEPGAEIEENRFGGSYSFVPAGCGPIVSEGFFCAIGKYFPSGSYPAQYVNVPGGEGGSDDKVNVFLNGKTIPYEWCWGSGSGGGIQTPGEAWQLGMVDELGEQIGLRVE